jgi:hypothetical protein
MRMSDGDGIQFCCESAELVSGGAIEVKRGVFLREPDRSVTTDQQSSEWIVGGSTGFHVVFKTSP